VLRAQMRSVRVLNVGAFIRCERGTIALFVLRLLVLTRCVHFIVLPGAQNEGASEPVKEQAVMLRVTGTRKRALNGAHACLVRHKSILVHQKCSPLRELA
jgi:hypothetical protein